MADDVVIADLENHENAVITEKVVPYSGYKDGINEAVQLMLNLRVDLVSAVNSITNAANGMIRGFGLS